MKVLEEVTKWSVSYPQPNHTYLVDGDRIVAYRPYHSDIVQVLSGKMRLTRARRKFIEHPVDYSAWGIERPKTNTITVQGSKGNTYEIDPDKGTCTCPAFTYRRTCKHIKEHLD